MYIATDTELEKLTNTVDFIDELYEKMGRAESYNLIEDAAIHYQLGKISDILHFSILNSLLGRKELL